MRGRLLVRGYSGRELLVTRRLLVRDLLERELLDMSRSRLFINLCCNPTIK